MTVICSEAFVFFGATGDLSYRLIVPSLLAMTYRCNQDISVISVAISGWTVDQFHEGAQ